MINWHAKKWSRILERFWQFHWTLRQVQERLKSSALILYWQFFWWQRKQFRHFGINTRCWVRPWKLGISMNWMSTPWKVGRSLAFITSRQNLILSESAGKCWFVDPGPIKINVSYMVEPEIRSLYGNLLDSACSLENNEFSSPSLCINLTSLISYRLHIHLI